MVKGGEGGGGDEKGTTQGVVGVQAAVKLIGMGRRGGWEGDAREVGDGGGAGGGTHATARGTKSGGAA